MQLFYPVTKKPISFNQLFEQNGNSYYKEAGLIGHGAIDFPCQFNETIYSACAGDVFAVRNKDNPDLMRYRSVYVIVEALGRFYELSYGHANLIFVKEGDMVDVGTPLMTGGNTGDVASGGVKITKEMKDQGSKAGTHLHFQLREVIPVDERKAGKKYLENARGTFKRNGQCFEILNYDNGYKGCIDPMPFFNGLYASDVDKPTPAKPIAHRWSINLQFGQYHKDIEMAQRVFIAQGLMSPIPSNELGWFGNKTVQAMLKYQTVKGITPVAPKYLGPKTRASLNLENIV